MKQQLLILATLLALFVIGEGRKVPQAGSLQKREYPTELWKINANWQSCQSRRIKVQIHDIKTSPVQVNIVIKQLDPVAEIEIDTTMELAGQLTLGSDSFEVDSAHKVYVVQWKDLNDPNHEGTIDIPKCWDVSASWHTCDTRKIRIAFHDIDEAPIIVRTRVWQIQLDGTLVLQCEKNLSIEAPAQPPYYEMCSVTLCTRNYTVEWVNLYNTAESGNITVNNCSTGGGWGDPHMRTFSGAKFNFQGHCNYTLVRDCRQNPPSFDISATFRGRYNPRKAPTRMVAVTTRVQGGDKYTFQEDNSVLVNGFPVLHRKFTIGDFIGHVQTDKDRVSLHLRENDITVEWAGKDHKVSVSVGNRDLVGKLCGMLGDGTNVKGHDLVKSDGTKTFNTTEFAESWVIPGSCI